MPAETRGSAFEKLIETECAKARSLANSHFTNDDLRTFLATQGTRFETYLKATTFPLKSPKGGFFDFINYLPGVVSVEAAKLHAFRQTYNDAKHDPNYSPSYLQLLQLFTDAVAAIKSINKLGLGLTNSPAPQSARRVFWLIVYDYYTGGDSTIVVTLPGDTNQWLGPREIDSINIKIDKLDDVCAALATLGKLHPPDGFIPEKLLKEWGESDSEFYRAYIYEGEYRDVIVTLAQYELRQDLLPGLNRGDDPRHVMLATLLAAVDLAAVTPITGTFSDTVKDRAKAVYALPDTAAELDAFSKELETLLMSLGPDMGNVTGPIWMSPDKFALLAPRAKARSSKMPVFIDESYRLVVRQSG